MLTLCARRRTRVGRSSSALDQLPFPILFLPADRSDALSDDVPEETKQRRLSEIIDEFRSSLRDRNMERESGRIRLVLVEGLSNRSTKAYSEARTVRGSEIEDEEGLAAFIDAPEATGTVTLTGRTDGNKRVLFPASCVLGSLSGPGGLETYLRKARSLETLCSISEWLQQSTYRTHHRMLLVIVCGIYSISRNR